MQRWLKEELRNGVFLFLMFSGLIGKSWAMLFVGAGYNVVIYDVVKSQLDNALLDIGKQLAALQERGLLRGTTSAGEQFQLIGTCDDLRQCVQDAVYVQVGFHFKNSTQRTTLC